MRLYWEVARRGFSRYATYRGATLAGVFTNSVFGFVRAYVLLAVVAARPVVGGFDRADLISYVWLGQGLLMVIYLWGWNEVALRIRAGDIATDLSRPFDFQGWWLAQDLGRAAYHAVFRGIPPFVLGWLAFRTLTLPPSALHWVAFAASLVLAVNVSFGIRYLGNLGAFWMLDHRGAERIVAAVTTFLSGFIVPITFFPTWLERVARALPFAAVLQIPVDIFLGHRTGASLGRGLALQAWWAVVVLGAGRIVLARATRRLVVQGG
jgi:ABC-2 type transport system permease protein